MHVSSKAIRQKRGPINIFYITCRKSFLSSGKKLSKLQHSSHRLFRKMAHSFLINQRLIISFLCYCHSWLPISLVYSLWRLLQSSNSWWGVIFFSSSPSEKSWQCLEAFFDHLDWEEGPTGTSKIEARHGAKQSTLHKTAPHPQQKWSALKCQ